MIDFLNGATALACLVVGAFFWRFYHQGKDRLFLIFALAFWVFSANRIILALLEEGHEAALYVYVSRLIAFVLILLAIIDKNYPRGRDSRG